jgi:hypothetical protein
MKSYAWPTCLYVGTLSWTHVVQAVHIHYLDTSCEEKDASFSGRRRSEEERPVSLVKNILRHPDASAGPSAPEEDEYNAVDVSFTRPMDNAQAKEVLSTVIVQVDFINCFARMCSVRLPVRIKGYLPPGYSVQLLRSVRATTNIGSVTSEGDLAMFSNLVRSRYGVDGSGLLIGDATTVGVGRPGTWPPERGESHSHPG